MSYLPCNISDRDYPPSCISPVPTLQLFKVSSSSVYPFKSCAYKRFGQLDGQTCRGVDSYIPLNNFVCGGGGGIIKLTKHDLVAQLNVWHVTFSRSTSLVSKSAATEGMSSAHWQYSTTIFNNINTVLKIYKYCL